MPSKDGIMNHLTCLLYLNLGKFKILKIMNLASNCRYPLWFPLLCQTWVWLSWSLSSLDPKQLQQETPHFIGLWPPNSPDLNLVDYKVWGVMQQRVYECHMNSTVNVWNSLQQNVIDAAINEWRKQLRACVRANGQHFEHLLWARVTNKSYGQIKYKSLKKMLVYCWTCDFQGS